MLPRAWSETRSLGKPAAKPTSIPRRLDVADDVDVVLEVEIPGLVVDAHQVGVRDGIAGGVAEREETDVMALVGRGAGLVELVVAPFGVDAEAEGAGRVERRGRRAAVELRQERLAHDAIVVDDRLGRTVA